MHRPVHWKMPPADAQELAQAAEFAALIDGAIAGREWPVVMAAEQRVLLETAAILRANLRTDGSVGSGVSGIVDQVMATATGHEVGEKQSSSQGDAGPVSEPVIDLAARRRRRVGWLRSVGTAAVAAAVVLFFAMRTPAPHNSGAKVASELSIIHHSRPADPLIGQIPREWSDRASDRLDTIYADRMAGYRDLRLHGGAR